jgi:uncharacterized protein (TIGR02453 family)
MNIHQSTINFLKDLDQNNNREWFQANKDRYEVARENVLVFTDELVKALHKVDPGIDTTLDPKKRLLRIYRDIRFSLDKTPYKNYFGVGKLSSGKNSGFVGYYLQIQPGHSFIAGGYWMPEADHLKAIRQEIDYNADELKKIIDAPYFKNLFGEFRDQDRLKTIPRDYDADNENIALLKLKSFIAERPLSDVEISSDGIIEKIASLCAEIYPLNMFLNNALG